MASMQYDVKSAYTTSDKVLVPYRARLKGIFISVSSGSATPIVFYDSATAASGNVLAQVSTAATGSSTVVIPGEGILAENGIYCYVGGAAAVTIFYG